MKSEQHSFVITNNQPPVIEMDTAAKSVYIRFKKTAVAKTVPSESELMHIAVDVDAKGEVVGVEAVGVQEFQIGMLLKKASVKTPDIDFSRARFIPAEMAGK